jgi:hypothetical protein
VIIARIHAEGQWHPGAIDLQGALRPHDSLLSRLPRLLGDFLAGDERTVEADQGAIEPLRGAGHAEWQQSPLSRLRRAGYP